MTDILISNPQRLNKLIEKFAHDGKEHFHVIADFDRTLTSAFADGKPRYALEQIFQEGVYLGPEFARRSKENFEKFYLIEIDPIIPLEEKKIAMHERRMRVFALMIEFWVKKDMIKHAMQSDQIVLRSGYEMFFDILKDNEIPLLVFSASGLWYDGIQYCLEKKIFLSTKKSKTGKIFYSSEIRLETYIWLTDMSMKIS